jgi:23S rRNA pseudouridine1911/1915/1917 synthase
LETGGVNTENQAEFQILDETEDFLAVDKPAGLLVHPTKPGGPRTLWDGLCELLGYELATGGRVSLVNRLDRETSGVLLVAKHAQAARGWNRHAAGRDPKAVYGIGLRLARLG